MLHSVNSERRLSVPEPADETYNIFINNIDSFHGKYILSSIYKQGFEELVPLEKQDDVDEIQTVEETDIEKIEKVERENEAEQEEEVSNFDQIFSVKTQGPRVVSKYKIFGSSVTASKQKPEEVFELTAENNEQFKNILSKCDCVIYDISLDETQIVKALTALSIIEQDIERKKCSASKNSAETVLFILISTCMTWALTARMDSNDPDPIPFIESDYRRRRPHPNFKEHYDCEREIMKKGKKYKGKLQTIIVCSGVTYGFEENMLAFLFKRAWSNDQYLPVFENGANFIPLIHVADLAKVICKLIDMPSPKNHYVLAVEQTPTCLKYIVKYISRALGSGRIEYVVGEEAYLYPEIDQTLYDILTANIVMEPEFIMSTLGISWRSEMNLVENIEAIVEEFKTNRNLEPLKIVIHGPPCSGKTKLARLLCEQYNLNYISVRSILDPTEAKGDKMKYASHSSHSTCKTRSKTKLKVCKTLDVDIEELEELLDEEDAEDLLELELADSEEENYQRNVVEENKKHIPRDVIETSSRLSDEYVAILLRNEMLRNHSQTLGFVLDGCPISFKQAACLYRNEQRKSTDSDDISKIDHKHDKRLIPTYVIDLDASNDFLLDRVSRKPEEEIWNTHYNERDMIRRLMTYREHNSIGNGPMAYFHECETEIVEINVSEFPADDMNCIFYIITKILGPPRGFGLSNDEILELEVVNEYQEKLRREKEELQKQMEKQNEKRKLDLNMKNLLEKYHHENIRLERLLAPKIENYRMFLFRRVLPVLFKAIMNVVEKKPTNPLDFFAEYLFKHNPYGYMYNPRFSRNGETLIENRCLFINNSKMKVG